MPKTSQHTISITVIIPTADRNHTLDRAIRSVLNQTLKPDKIIVVDNGYQHAETHEDIKQQVHFIKTMPRLGPGKARNAGAAIAETEYISFLDDDDVWEKDYLKYSIEALKITCADAVVGQLKKADPHGQAKAYKMFPADPKKQRKVYFKSPGFGGQNLVISKKMFALVGGFDETMPASVDRDLAAKIIEHRGFIVPQPYSVAVLHNHESARVRDNIVLGNIMFIQKHWKHMTFFEIFMAFKTLIKRYLKLKLKHRNIKTLFKM
ncbi:glycosyl transferase family 2 [Desulfonatronospira thiodismutans ASO3-1]|uniref:Glycosyl transferase family 2 n=1 Tax=Desulfonatronospira thiodismutans ASO3-1 TaxID=555779 RepID=D6STK5_9BACT|nr:glycosyltransferase family 2 protein [Desulfonatronospira thiodismutans]EFI34021.1 glycosyl transferase family 2 [Desulfonatronospira thiodismutans ASO3-1]